MSHTRAFPTRMARTAALLTLLLACDADRPFEPVAPVLPAEPHPELVRYALALRVDVVTARVTPLSTMAQDSAGGGAGPSFSLVGNAEIATTISKVTRGTPVGNRVPLTFDVALTSLLNSGNLVTPTFPVPPASVEGLLLIPFQIRDKQGLGTVREGPAWDGPPHNFFNDLSCGSAAGTDCYRYQVFPSPLAPQATTAPQTVGFDIDTRVRSFTVLMILAADIENTPLPSPGAGAIAGRVVSPLAGALAGVTVTAGAREPVTTDIAGGYELTGVPLGDVSVALSGLPDGCTDPGPGTATVLSGGIATVDFSVTCPAPPATTGTVAGTVTSPTLGNLYGVIAAVNPGNRGGATDGAGAYAIPGVPGGQVTVTLSNLPSGCLNPGAQEATVVAGGSVAVNFTVSCDGTSGTGALTGGLSGSGGAIEGALVTLQPGNRTTTTDPGGVFSFGNLTPGPVLLTFSDLPAACANPGTRVAEIVAGRTAALNVQATCTPVGSIAGTVQTFFFGIPVAGLVVSATGGGRTFTAESGPDGAFALAWLPPADYTLSVMLPPECVSQQGATVTVVAFQAVSQDVFVDCPGTIRGTVTWARGHLPAGLGLSFFEGGSHEVPVGTQLDGAYAVRVNPGRYFLGFFWRSDPPRLIGEPECTTISGPGVFDLAPRQEFVANYTVDCVPGGMSGSVTDLTGQPVADATITVTPTAGGASSSAAAGGDGAFTLAELTTGQYGVVAARDGCAPYAGGPVTVVSGQVATTSITLDCPSVAGGTVTMTEGALPAGLQVVFTPGQAGPTLTATVGSDGTWGATLGIDEYIVTLQGLPALCGIESQSAQSVDAIGQQRSFVVNFTVRCEGLTVTPEVYDYGEVGVDAPEAATFTLTNTSSTAIGFDDSEWSGDQSDFIGDASTTCNFSLTAAIPAGGSCTLTLIFSPSGLGSRSATFTLTPTSGGPVAITLVGVGVVGGSMLTFTPSSFDYGAVELGTQGAPMTFTLTNTGPVTTGPLTGEFTGATGDFVPLGGGFGDPRATCVGALGAGLPPGLSCTVTFQFVPQAIGPRAVEFTVRGQPGGTVSLVLSGNGVTTNSLTLTPSPLAYEAVALGSARQLSFLLTNTGSVTTGQLGGVGFNGPNAGDFNLVAGTTCGGISLPVLGPGGSCVLAIEFRPQALGDRTASFTIGATPGGTATAELSGVGVTTLLAFSPASHDFGSLAVGSFSPTVRFTLTNTAPEPSGGFIVQMSGEQNDFPAIGTDCQLSGLAPGASCFMDFQFAPLANGVRSFTPTFGSAAAGAVSLTLSGTGTGGFSTDGAVGGLVRDLDAQPVAGALVTGGSSQFTTAADGRYTLPDLAPGSHSVTAVKSGFCIETVQTVPVTSGQTTALDFELDCQGQVRGNVIPAAGTVPPPGMEIEYTSLADGLVAATAFVFPDLQYGPIGLPNGTFNYRLIAQDCGSIGGAVTVTQQSEQSVDLPVECLTTVAGSLSSPTRTPETFAFQTVFVGGNAATTDENGAFSVSNVAPGPLTIEVVLEVLGCVPPEPFEVTAIQSRTVRADVTIDCPGMGVVQGVVRDLDGVPVAGALVSLVNAAIDQSTITDAQGNYEIGQVLAIDATLRVVSGGLCLPSQPAPLTVQAGANNILDLTANCPGMLTGVVTSSSSGPIAGITVGVSETGPAGTTWLPVTDATGTYRIQGDGSFLVFIPLGNVPAGCTQPPSQPAVVRQQGQVTVNIPLTCP